MLHTLSLVHRFADDLSVPDFPDFKNFMYLNQGSCVAAYTQKNLVS